MAGLTTLARDLTLDRDTQATYLTIVSVQQKGAPWELAPTVNESGLPQHSEVVEVRAGRAGMWQEEPRRAPADLWRMVAPGVMVRDSEYAARYSHLDLGALRQRLTPEKFLAFVRHIGFLEGRDGVDVGALVHEESR
ncbi:MAG: hypothetical protein ABJB97_11830 [Acidobacteriota bacterium]